MFFSFTALSALVSLAAIAPTRAAQINVVVGGPGGVIAYNPQFVNATPGDVVTFQFQQKNHTATQSTLANPCSPAAGGFDSGFVPVPENDTSGPFPIAQFTVKDTNPVWVYCRQTGHCQQGMVFAINPGNQFQQFLSNAMGTASSSTAAPSPSASAGSTTDHTVMVGGSGTLTYNPPNITAQPGDTVTFQFQTKNHTITQSSFADPCRALTLTSTSGQVGFDSGFMPVANGSTSFPSFTIQVNNTSPIWGYCRQTGHCGQGMVFAINANESSANTFEAFQAKAKQLNGTGSNSSTPSSHSGSGVSKIVSSAGVATALVAVVFGLVI